MEHNISIKQIFYDILSIKEQVVKEYQGKEPYKKLIDYINAKDYYNDDNIPYPTLKQVEEETGIKSYQLRKQLKKIYENLFDYEYDYSFNFNEIEIMISVDYFKRYASIKCNNFAHIPRVGENIRLPFLKAKIGTDCYYVEDITHEFVSNKQIINIHLKGG